LLLHGQRIADGSLDRTAFFKEVGVNPSTFRSAAEAIGALRGEPGLRFFDVSDETQIAFGPGAGLVLGVSIGTASCRAALVDANGRLFHQFSADDDPLQLDKPPEEVLDRLRMTVEEVLRPGLDDPSLSVYGKLPLLGVSVAWPTPVDRNKRPAGGALTHRAWHSGQSLTQRVARALSMHESASNAMNDAHAAAMAVAWKRTRGETHRDQQHKEIAMVVRLGGGVGAATVIIARPAPDEHYGTMSGFLNTVLIGGVDRVGGEIGHLPASAALIDRLRKKCPDDIGTLSPFSCSCVSGPNDVPHHVEAYAGAAALAHRLAPGEPPQAVLRRVRADPDNERHLVVLRDAGAIVGEALLGPMAMLNPGSITITGLLAEDATLTGAVDGQLADVHPICTHPHVRRLEGDENKYVGVRGAALLVLRRAVYRELPTLLDTPKRKLPARVQRLTKPIDEIPWARHRRQQP
jgi:predicted NBD/HSP70 family sugar kinase